MRQLPKISVRGRTPAPWGVKNQWEWRDCLTAQTWSIRSLVDQQQIQETSEFHVKVVFWMTEPHVKHADLDNLAKPVLDTLFLIRNAQCGDSRTGALFDVDDNRVFELTAEKRIVPLCEEEGVDVTVAWW